MRAHCHRWWKSAGMTDLRFRMAVRAVILDDDDRVLLCRFSAPHPAVPDGVEGVQWLQPLTRRTTKRQVTCSFLRRPVNATNRTSATSASLTHCCSCSSNCAFGYLIGVHTSWLMLVIAAVTLLVILAVTENHAWWRIAVPTNAHP